MLRIFMLITCVLVGTLAARAQAPGVDPRGVAEHSATVVIGVVDEPLRMVIRPDRVAKTTDKVQPDGTYIVELPQRPLDYLVGYIFRVRIQEVLKSNNQLRANQMIEVFAPFKLEGGVSLSRGQRFLLSLAAFIPTKKQFGETKVLKVGQSPSTQGTSFDLRSTYHTVVADSDGAVLISEKNRGLVDDIRILLRNH